MIIEKITREWLVEQGAYADDIEWWEKHGSDSVVDTLRVVHAEPKFAHWLIKKLLANDKQVAVKVAVFSARLSLDKYPGDKTPLLAAIEAAEAVIANDCKETRAAARAAWGVAMTVEAASEPAAAWAAWAAWREEDSSLAAALAAREEAVALPTILDELIRMILVKGMCL